MALSKLWAGRVYGTNTGNLFISLAGEDSDLTGTLHFNEPGVGVVVYDVRGSFDGATFQLTGIPRDVDGIQLGNVSATATLTAKGELTGSWASSIGSAGTVFLFPHEIATDSTPNATAVPDQLHTARFQIGAVKVDKAQIVACADEMQREFKNAQVVVTVSTETERSRLLQDFKSANQGHERASLIKLFVQEQEIGGLNRIAVLEFGPNVNFVMAQGSDEAWVLGMLEKLKRNVRRFERTYATSYKKMGLGVNQVLLTGAIVFLPSLPGLIERAMLMSGILVLVYSVNVLHDRYLPNAVVFLDKAPTGILARIAPSALSWVIAVTAGLVAALLAAVLN